MQIMLQHLCQTSAFQNMHIYIYIHRHYSYSKHKYKDYFSNDNSITSLSL